ncbi:MAG: 16S rRNA (cytosine(967)-C(5))-methyltransferase RsmB [Kangiellaceae bacterium]|nr:16S rRNA (cytosine(967)-C(5))-methyltransferase RsmB [Kangiellaceae bacterium]
MTKPHKTQDLRYQACLALQAIAFRGKSASDVLSRVEFENMADTSLFKSLVLGACRQFIRLEAASKQLLQKPFKAKDSDLACLIIIGLYQLEYSRIPDHAAISETVDTCQQLKKPWACKVVNAVLRNFVRQKATIFNKLDSNWDSKYSYPDWFINLLKPAYKGHVENILENGNQQAPMSLRVNLSKIERTEYLEKLAQQGIQASPHPIVASAIVLDQPASVHSLPLFAEGYVSVQDPAAQLAAWILQPQAGMKILDACAAPGGKSAHLLEMTGNVDLIAADIDSKRLERVEQNLERLQLRASIVCQDMADSDFVDNSFDQILLDAPCSATGVIRRHPDIKLLRRAEDIDNLVQLQQQILEHLWSKLKVGGQLLYATCSILSQENSQQIEGFLACHKDAKLLDLPPAIQELSHNPIGCQLLPGQLQMDGFYYALLQKH